MASLTSPCIGICSTVYGDEVCRGCKRLYREVIEWNGYSLTEKQAVYARLQQQIAAVLSEYIEIIDETRLHLESEKWQLRLQSDVSSAERAFHLLRVGAHKITQLEAYGLRVKPFFSELSVPMLFNQIDTQLYQLANT